MSLREKTRRILRAYGVIPRKRLGQSFLVNESIMQKMASYASLSKQETVLEIGAGLGFLTEILAKKAGQVVAVEIDSRLAKVLERRLRQYSNVNLLQGDILKLEVPDFDKVVSTPPYSISSPLLFWLFEKRFSQAVLAFQEEFARRLAAAAGSKDYGRLTVATWYNAEVELLDLIPREMFWPPPKVDSMIVRLTPRKPPFHVKDERFFFQVVRTIFTQRNKKLRNAIMPFLNSFAQSKMEALKIADSLPFHNRRPRELAPEEICVVANELFDVVS